MNLSVRIKPIRYFKAHAAEIIGSLSEQQRPLIIIQKGEAKAVVQGIASYEQTQETLALTSLADSPNRGAYPKELLELAICDKPEQYRWCSLAGTINERPPLRAGGQGL